MYFIRLAAPVVSQPYSCLLRHRAWRWGNGPTARIKNGLKIFGGLTTICTPSETWAPNRNTAVERPMS
jgi:hypothetical protein